MASNMPATRPSTPDYNNWTEDEFLDVFNRIQLRNLAENLESKTGYTKAVQTIFQALQSRKARGGGKTGWVQAVLFPLDSEFNTSKKRLAFIKKMGLKPLKRVHKTDTYHRYRITEPLNNTEKRIIKNNPDVHFIYEFKA